MTGKLKHPINIRLTDQQYEDFLFICDVQKKDFSKVLRAFIDEYIEKHIDILRHDETHFDIHVETEDSKRIWVNVTEEEQKRDYTYIETENVYKRKVKK
jgi:hypothetical protein